MVRSFVCLVHFVQIAVGVGETLVSRQRVPDGSLEKPDSAHNPKKTFAKLLLANAGGLPPRLQSTRPSNPHMKLLVDTNPLELEWGYQSPQIELPENIKEGSAPLEFKISDEQRKQFDEDGVLHIPGLLSEEWIEYLRSAVEWQISHPHVWSLPGVKSGIYDYIQRGVWTSNSAFAKFLYYSPLASALGGVAQADELRLSTDLLMVNPNKGFAWHQDNMNGPIEAFGDGQALRWWVTLDDCPPDHGAPVYLKGSHRNTGVSKSAVNVDLQKDGLGQYDEMLEFRPKAGDLIVWHAKSIHKIDGPQSQDWDQRKRRVYGGTVAINNAEYISRFDFSDMSPHELTPGEPLKSPAFPRIYPTSDSFERAECAKGNCMKTPEGVWRVWSKVFAGSGELLSWTKVTNEDKKN